jgi:hypothetical protein
MEYAKLGYFVRSAEQVTAHHEVAQLVKNLLAF